MEKKSVSATILVLFLALTFSVIGICFSVFVYPKTKITIENVLISASNISVYKDKELKTKIDKLELSKMELGLKPATGELDSESQIPSSITDKGTSEGYYASVYIPSGKDYKISVTNVKIETEKNQTEADFERRNIFVSIKDVLNTTKSIENNVTVLVWFENNNEVRKLTFLFWLGSLASDKLVGAKISFTLLFEEI